MGRGANDRPWSATDELLIRLGGQSRRSRACIAIREPGVRRLLNDLSELVADLCPTDTPMASRPEIVGILLRAYDDPSKIAEQVGRFVEDHRLGVAATLRRLAHRDVPARRPAPETLMLLERLHNAPDHVSALWPRDVSRIELDEAARLSGSPLDPATHRDSRH